jgi:predicted nucleic-acid-binding Zn-ribbon protein
MTAPVHKYYGCVTCGCEDFWVREQCEPGFAEGRELAQFFDHAPFYRDKYISIACYRCGTSVPLTDAPIVPAYYEWK